MISTRILHLNLHREHFAAVVAGTKRIEYRDQSPHWRSRLEGRTYDVIQFRNGYASKAPEMTVKFLGLRRYGRGRTAYYAIRLGEVVKIKRWSPCRTGHRGKPEAGKLKTESGQIG